MGVRFHLAQQLDHVVIDGLIVEIVFRLVENEGLFSVGKKKSEKGGGFLTWRAFPIDNLIKRKDISLLLSSYPII